MKSIKNGCWNEMRNLRNHALYLIFCKNKLKFCHIFTEITCVLELLMRTMTKWNTNYVYVRLQPYSGANGTWAYRFALTCTKRSFHFANTSRFRINNTIKYFSVRKTCWLTVFCGEISRIIKYCFNTLGFFS